MSPDFIQNCWRKIHWFLVDYHPVENTAKSETEEDSDGDVSLPILKEIVVVVVDNDQQEFKEIEMIVAVN